MAFRNKTPLHKQPIFIVFKLQVVLIFLIAGIALLTKSYMAGYSAMLGGFIALLPNVYFAQKAFQYFGAQSVMAVASSMWVGETVKYVLTAVLFALIFVFVKQVELAILFGTYFIMLLTSLFGLFFVR